MYKCRIVWAGDYADTEKDAEKDSSEHQNLSQMAEEMGMRIIPTIPPGTQKSNYLVNHTLRFYIDMSNHKGIHPLPLLVAEGNGRGGGDYSGKNQELCGTWARHSISMENDIPVGYTEFVCNFTELDDTDDF